MSYIEVINTHLNKFVWGPFTLVLLFGVGLYFSVFTNFIQIKKLKLVFHETLFKFFQPKKNKTSITPSQALSTALAGTMGTGNIAGVATAIIIGGPGAIFWMWISAFFGMMTKYAEVFLAIKYRKKNKKGEWVGGPMYYMENGLNSRFMGITFAFFGLFASFGIGNMTQINSISEAMKTSFNIPPIFSGFFVAFFIALVIIGGSKRIYAVSQMIIPLMSVLYILGALYVIFNNFAKIPQAFYEIFVFALKPAPAVGGFLGATVRDAIHFGFARGVFSNEAGMGSAPIAHAAADTDSPIRQGLWGIFEVFADTILSCTLTALVILVTGVWKFTDGGAAITIMAFKSEMGAMGGYFVSISVLFFAYASILGWCYYGEKCIEYISGGKGCTIYKIIFIIIIVFGSTRELYLVWSISDTLNGLMALPNIIALILLSNKVIKATNKGINRL